MGATQTRAFGFAWLLLSVAMVMNGDLAAAGAMLGISSLHFQIASLKEPRP